MGTQRSGIAKTYPPSTLGHFTDVSKQQHPREYGGAVGWWVVVGGLLRAGALVDDRYRWCSAGESARGAFGCNCVQFGARPSRIFV